MPQEPLAKETRKTTRQAVKDELPKFIISQDQAFEWLNYLFTTFRNRCGCVDCRPLNWESMCLVVLVNLRNVGPQSSSEVREAMWLDILMILSKDKKRGVS